MWPFQEFVETVRACYLIRQYVFSNLYDRLSMRPFLAPIEKVGRRQSSRTGAAQRRAPRMRRAKSPGRLWGL